MRKGCLLVAVCLISYLGTASDRAMSLLSKVDSAHRALEGVKIGINSKVYSSNNSFVSLKGLNYRSEKINYFSMEGLRFFSVPKDNLNIQVLDRNQTVILSRSNTSKSELEYLNKLIGEQIISDSKHYIFQIVASDKDKIQLHITTLKKWEYSLISYKIDPKSFLIKEVVYVPQNPVYSGYFKTIIAHEYVPVKTIPEEADVASVIKKKKGKWILSDSISHYTLINRLQN